MKDFARIAVLIVVGLFCVAGYAPVESAADEPGASSPFAAADHVDEVLVVSGIVTPDGGSLSLPFALIPANDHNLKKTRQAPDKGSHSVKFLDAKGEVLSKIAWTPVFHSEDPDKPVHKAAFTWLVIPKKGVVEVQLQVSNRKVDGFRVSAKEPQIDDFRAEMVTDADDQFNQRIKLTWTVSHPDLDRTDDVSRFRHQVYYSNDDGATWILVEPGLQESSADINLIKLPGGSRCLLRVSTTDGFNSSSRLGPHFSVADKPPLCVWIAPQSGKMYRAGAGVLLIGRCVDLEEGVLPNESLVWVSDTQGVLGQEGKLVTRNLRVGTHRITLQAADSAGNEGKSLFRVITIVPR